MSFQDQLQNADAQCLILAATDTDARAARMTYQAEHPEATKLGPRFVQFANGARVWFFWVDVPSNRFDGWPLFSYVEYRATPPDALRAALAALITPTGETVEG